MTALLDIEGLSLGFPRPGGGWNPVVRDLSFHVQRGELVGLVGESGSGKSLTALAILGLIPPPGKLLGGKILFEGTELTGLREPQWRRFRGSEISMVFQEPSTAMNPVLTIGSQIVEAIRLHRPLGKREAREEAEQLLEMVAIPEPRRRLSSYPHELSGGQRQRAMIAMALAGRPKLLLADEPTTALDVTIQAQILELLERLREELNLAVLLVSHDLAVIAETCERVLVMYAGQLVEEAPAAQLFRAPEHPYTRGLLAALPYLGRPAARGELPSIPGQVPEAEHRPSGCAFHPRCAERLDRCSLEAPPLISFEGDRRTRCFLRAIPAEEKGTTP